jgi:hypothetical protein
MDWPQILSLYGLLKGISDNLVMVFTTSLQPWCAARKRDWSYWTC